MRPFVRSFLVLLVLVSSIGRAAAVVEPTVDRDLQRYLILGLRAARVKNISVAAPGCSIGANCPSVHVPGGCGVVNASGATIADPGILAADRACVRGRFWSVFRNDPHTCSLA